MSKKDLIQSLAEVPLFSRCTKRELATVARHAETVELEDGTEMIKEGDPGDAFFMILDGNAKVIQKGEEVADVGPGAWFGELALLDDRPRSATVVATSPITVAVLGVRMFRTILREFPDISELLLAGLAGQLREART